MGTFDKVTRSLSAAFSTLLVAYPFYALIGRLSVLDPPILQPCNKGCTFIRYWGSPGLPRSAPRYMENDATLSGDPVFVTIQNGEQRTLVDKPTWYSNVQRSYTKYALAASDLFRGGGSLFETLTDIDVLNQTNDAFVAADCAHIGKEEMMKRCSSTESKLNVHNHLSRGSSVTLQLYLWSIPFWALFRLIHDWLIIWEHMPEVVTLVVGYISVLPQIAAVASGFLWCIGAAEVFRTVDPAHPGCACYYEMDTIPMFAVIATPVGLYMATRAKVWKLAYATLHGDYLYTVSYDVPYRTSALANTDPTYDFLSSDVVDAGSTVPAKVMRGLHVAQYPFLRAFFANIAALWNFGTLYFVYAFAFPTLAVRFYDVVVVNIVKDGHRFGQYGTVAFGGFALLAPVFVYYKQSQKLYSFIALLVPELDRIKRGAALHVTVPNVIMPFNMLFQLLQILTACYFATLSLWLARLCYRGQEVTAENAGYVGAGGFFILSAFLNSWVPSDTGISSMIEAIAIKGGTLPWDGLSGIERLNTKNPHLGLKAEAAAAAEFKTRCGPDDDIVNHGWGITEEDKKKWKEFLKEEVDKGRDKFAPTVGCAR